jgi:hypothetical protein
MNRTQEVAGSSTSSFTFRTRHRGLAASRGGRRREWRSTEAARRLGHVIMKEISRAQESYNAGAAR